jgi:hypothetical protein
VGTAVDVLNPGSTATNVLNKTKVEFLTRPDSCSGHFKGLQPVDCNQVTGILFLLRNATSSLQQLPQMPQFNKMPWETMGRLNMRKSSKKFIPRQCHKMNQRRKTKELNDKIQEEVEFAGSESAV